jgi:hypothetical protein
MRRRRFSRRVLPRRRLSDIKVMADDPAGVEKASDDMKARYAMRGISIFEAAP